MVQGSRVVTHVLNVLDRRESVMVAIEGTALDLAVSDAMNHAAEEVVEFSCLRIGQLESPDLYARWFVPC